MVLVAPKMQQPHLPAVMASEHLDTSVVPAQVCRVRTLSPTLPTGSAAKEGRGRPFNHAPVRQRSLSALFGSLT
jgi:hypothetical protein